MILNVVINEKITKCYFIDAYVKKSLFGDRIRLMCYDLANPKKRFDKKLSMFILNYQSSQFYKPMNFNRNFKKLMGNLKVFLKPSLRNGYVLGALYMFLKVPHYRKRLMKDFYFNPMSSMNLIPFEKVTFNNRGLFSSMGLLLLSMGDMELIEYTSNLPQKTKLLLKNS